MRSRSWSFTTLLQRLLLYFISSSRKSHIHAGTATNCTTARGTSNLFPSSLHSGIAILSVRGHFICWQKQCIFFIRMLYYSCIEDTLIFIWKFHSSIPLWRTSPPKQVASKPLTRCSLVQSLHVYDFFCYWKWNEGAFFAAYAGWWNIPNLVQRNTILADWPLHLHVLLVETPTGNEGISL